MRLSVSISSASTPSSRRCGVHGTPTRKASDTTALVLVLVLALALVVVVAVAVAAVVALAVDVIPALWGSSSRVSSDAASSSSTMITTVEFRGGNGGAEERACSIAATLGLGTNAVDGPDLGPALGPDPDAVPFTFIRFASGIAPSSIVSSVHRPRRHGRRPPPRTDPAAFEGPGADTPPRLDSCGRDSDPGFVPIVRVSAGPGPKRVPFTSFPRRPGPFPFLFPFPVVYWRHTASPFFAISRGSPATTMRHAPSRTATSSSSKAVRFRIAAIVRAALRCGSRFSCSSPFEISSSDTSCSIHVASW